MRLVFSLLAAILLSCATRTVKNNLIFDRIFDPNKYHCSAGDMDLDQYVLIGDSLLDYKLSSVRWCFEVGLISPSMLNIPQSSMNIINAKSVNLTCDDGILIANEFYLINKLFLYKLQRAHEMCYANSYDREKVKKQDVSF